MGERPFAWRFRVPKGHVAWDDVLLGRVELDPSQVGGDFLVGRNTLGPSYQLAVVTDDAMMGVTQVIRGLDLVPSTPRQILLYRALGWNEPRFGHVPLAITTDGRRLAKREGSIKLSTLRQGGVDSRRLVGGLIKSCGWSSCLVPSTLPRLDCGLRPQQLAPRTMGRERRMARNDSRRVEPRILRISRIGKSGTGRADREHATRLSRV